MFLDFSCQIQSSSAFIQLCDKTKNQTRGKCNLKPILGFHKIEGKKNLKKKKTRKNEKMKKNKKL